MSATIAVLNIACTDADLRRCTIARLSMLSGSVVGILEQGFPVHRLVGDLGQFGDEIHHLVLEQGGADLGLGLLVLA